ncbi:geranyl diphosphate synthase-like [Anthonomus grandis grandis]|uniref:geranyl diphosphate synthase-like n=1 Tax=Anthonomus grandis grandis TaxID=2921223 RepID=UPI0021659890|nr:geranyl diphosphate synthase-like [Anthonomus grandis grandis]
MISSRAIRCLTGSTSPSFKIAPIFSNAKRSFKQPNVLKRPLYESPEMKRNKQVILDTFPKFRQILQTLPEYKEIPEVIDRIATAVEYASSNGKLWRSTSILRNYEIAASPEDLTPEKYNNAALMAATVEILHGVILQLDDIQDDADIRRGVKAFYALPGKTRNCVGELFAAESTRNLILATAGKSHPSYQTVRHLYNKHGLLTYMGQLYDTLFYDESTKKPVVEAFTMDIYEKLTMYKTTYYTISMPIEIGLALSNKYDEKKIKENYHIVTRLGLLFQMMNDFKDLFRNQGEILKSEEMNVGMDIPTYRITWFTIRTLERGTPAQKKEFWENIGRSDPEKIMKIVSLYEDLRLDELFLKEENDILRYVQEEIPKIRNGIPHEMYYEIANKSFRADIRTLN